MWSFWYLLGLVLMNLSMTTGVEITVLVDDILNNYRIYLDGDELKVAIGRSGFHNVDQLEASCQITNSSWGREFKFPNINDSDTFWNFTLRRKEITFPSSKWFPKEKWSVTFSVSEINGTTIGTEKRTLLDTTTEPILQWSLGNAGLSPSIASYSQSSMMLISHSPCASDVAVITPRFTQATPGLHLGVTHDAFHTSPTWYYISAMEMYNGQLDASSVRRKRSTTQCYNCVAGPFYKVDYDNCMASQTVQNCPSGNTDCYIEYQVQSTMEIKLIKRCWASSSSCAARVVQKSGTCNGAYTYPSECAVCCSGELCNDYIPGYPPGRETTVSADVETTESAGATTSENSGTSDSGSGIILFDLKLTNHHLILVTDKGVFASVDLRNLDGQNQRDDYLQFQGVLSMNSSDCDYVNNGKVSYTPQCLNDQASININLSEYVDITIQEYSPSSMFTDFCRKYSHFIQKR